MANAFYDLGRKAFLDGGINFGSDTIKACLIKSTYTPNLATHQYVSDLGANRIGTDQTLATKTTTAGVADADDVTYLTVTTGSTVTYVGLYKSTGMDSTSPLICLLDTATGLPLSTNGGDITVQWDNGANKIFKL